MFNTSNKQKPGFTLIELLLAVAIIAVLSVLVFVALKPAQILEDAKNTGDDLKMQMLQGALRQYYFKYDQYPPGLSETPVTICSPGTVGLCLPLDDELANVIDDSKYFLPQIPQSPLFQSPDSGFEVSLDGNLVKVAYKGATVANQCTVNVSRAYNFDGSNDYIAVPNITTANLENFTITTWMKSDDNNRGVLFGNYSSSPNFNFELHTSGRIRAYWRSGQVDFFSPNNMWTAGAWHHVTLVRDKNLDEFRIYVDGNLEATSSSAGSDISGVNAASFKIGKDSRDGLTAFDGKMFDTRFYNKVLSASEVSNVYTFGATGNYPGVGNLVAQYKMNDVDNAVAYDSSGNGNHGTKAGITPNTFHYAGNDVPFNTLRANGFSDYSIVSNDSQQLIPASAFAGKDSSTLSFDITTTDRQFVLFTSNSSSPYLLVSDDGGTSTVHDNTTDFEKITIDGVEFAGTRDGLDARLADGETHSVTVEGIDFTQHSRWATHGLYAGGYASSSWYFTGRIENVELDGVAYANYIPRDESDIAKDVLGADLECVGTGEVQEETYIAEVSLVATTASAAEPSTNGLFTVSLDSPNTSGVPIVVNYTIAGNAGNGTDYNTINSYVLIPNNVDNVTIPVNVINDSAVEGVETVTLTLTDTSNSNITIDPIINTASVTITSEDTVFGAMASVSATTATASEPSTNGVFTIALDGINTSGSPITVNYNVTGSATSGTDYTSIGTSAIIPTGQSSVPVNVAVLEDNLLEGSENVTITITGTSNPSVTIGGANTSTVTIEDDDVALIAIDTPDPMAAEPDDNGQFSFTLSKVNNTGVPIVVTYAISGSASNGSDFDAIGTTISILDGESSKTLDIDVMDDSDDEEGPEEVTLTLNGTNNSSVTVDTNSASDTVNLMDNDANASTYVANMDGDDDFIDANAIVADLVGKSGYTVSGRFKTNTTSLSALWGHNTSGGSNQAVLMLNGNSNVGDLRLYVVNGYYLTINGSYNNNEWHDFSFTVNSGGNSSLTVNGSTVTGNIPNFTINSTDQINIGMELDGGPSQSDFYKGLLGRYTVIDNSSTIANLLIDEGTGTAIADSSGNSNNATANNITESTFWVDEDYEPSYLANFAGDNDYIDTGVDSNISALSGNRTYFASIQPDDVSDDSAVAYRLITQSNNSSTRLSLGINDSKPAFYYRDNSGNTVEGNTTLVAGQDYTLALVYDDTNNNIKLYVNGVLDTTETGVGTLSSTNSAHIRLGVQNNSTNRAYDGLMYSAQTFSSALTAAEVLEVHNGTSTKPRVFHYELDEGAGTTINDSSGNNRNGTAQNIVESSFWELAPVPPPVVLRDPEPKRAYAFDNSNDYIDVDPGIINLIENNTEGTISTWVYNAGSGWDGLITASSFTEWDSHLRLQKNTDHRLRFAVEENNVILLGATTTNTLPLNTWTHVAVTMDGTGTKVYLNGVLETLTFSQGSQSSQEWFNAVGGLDKFVIGAHAKNNTHSLHWNGKIFDTRIYDKALTSSEVTNVYTFGTSGTNPTTTNLVAQYKMDDTGTLAYDSSGNDNHGTKEGINASAFHYEGSDVPYSWQNAVGFSNDGAWVFGNENGDDSWWGDFGPDSTITFDPSKRYRIIYEDVQASGAGDLIYGGWMGYAANGTTRVNYAGSNSYSSQHYHAIRGSNPLTKTTYTGYTLGQSTPGNNNLGTLANPRPMHSNVAFIRPFLLVNHNDRAGRATIGKVIIDVVDASDNVLENIATYKQYH